MPYTRPGLGDLISTAEADIESRLPGADVKLRRSNLNVLARILAAGLHGLYGFGAWIARQVMPDSADGDYLDRWASIWLATPRVPAEFATGQVVMSGTSGYDVPAGTTLQRADGAQYTVTAGATLAGGTATVTAAALVAGQAGNTPAGVALYLVSPLAGVSAAATVASGGLAGGADEEADASVLARLLARIRNPPMGGAAQDYVAWALEVPGVTRAWVHAAQLGEVDLYFVRDGDASFIPDAGEVSAVQAHIDALRPVTALFTARAPVADAINYTLHISPDTPTIRAAVAAELADLHLREAVPGGTLRISHIREAISLAAGEEDSTVTAPAADVVSAAGHIATLGSITWA